MRDISADIIEKAAAGDVDAFEQVYKQYSSLVYSLALGITRNREDAEEAAQDAFIRIFKGLKYFRYGSGIGTWIYRIATNSALNVYRARSRRRGLTANIEDAGEIPDAQGAQPKDGLAQQESKAALAEILGRLSSEHRTCLMLREIEGLDYKEMAQVLKVPINTVRSRLARARQALIACCTEGRQ